MSRSSFMQAALVMAFVSFALSSCAARPLVEETSPGLFSGSSGEYIVYQDGGRRRK